MGINISCIRLYNKVLKLAAKHSNANALNGLPLVVGGAPLERIRIELNKRNSSPKKKKKCLQLPFNTVTLENYYIQV